MDNSRAFLGAENKNFEWIDHGMSLLEYYAGQALSNHSICTGTATEYNLRAWFGDRGGITREEIAAKQAFNFAKTMLLERKRNEQT